MTYVDAVAQSVMAGCDFSDKEYEQNIPAAFREGKLTEARLDDALRFLSNDVPVGRRHTAWLITSNRLVPPEGIEELLRTAG